MHSVTVSDTRWYVQFISISLCSITHNGCGFTSESKHSLYNYLVDNKTRHPNGQEHGLVGGRDEATGLLRSKCRQTSAQLRVRHGAELQQEAERKEARKAERKHSTAQGVQRVTSAADGEHPEHQQGRRSKLVPEAFLDFLHLIQLYCKSPFSAHRKLSSAELINTSSPVCPMTSLPPHLRHTASPLTLQPVRALLPFCVRVQGQSPEGPYVNSWPQGGHAEMLC